MWTPGEHTCTTLQEGKKKGDKGAAAPAAAAAPAGKGDDVAVDMLDIRWVTEVQGRANWERTVQDTMLGDVGTPRWLWASGMCNNTPNCLPTRECILDLGVALAHC